MTQERVEILLHATDQASGPIRNVRGSLSSLGTTGGGVSALGKAFGIVERGVGTAVTNLERYAVRAGIATIGAGTEAVRWSVDFSKNMALIETQAGASHDEVVKMTAALKSMAAVTATGPIDLSTMLYHVESAGVRGAAALDILKTAALGVKVGMTDDAESVVNAMIAIQQSSINTISGINGMGQAMSVLDAIIGNGNMRMADLANAMSTGILGTAKTFGVSLQSVGAALALLTDTGVPAQNAATRLTHSIVLMAAPTAQATKILKKLGLDQFQLAKDLKSPDGFYTALTDLQRALAAHGEFVNGKLTPQGAGDLARAFGGSRFSATIMQLLQALPLLENKYGNIIGLQDKFDQRVTATQATAAYQFQQLFANIQTIGIGIGDALVPGLLRINTALNNFIGANQGGIKALTDQLGSWFSKFVDNLMKVDWGAVASGIGTVASAVGGLVQAFMGMPDWAKGLFLGTFALNKLTGGMVTDLAGLGVKTGLGALSGFLRGGASGAASQVIGSIGATPVFVTNWPAGGFGGGGGVPTPNDTGPGNTISNAVRNGLLAAPIVAVGLQAKNEADSAVGIMDSVNQAIQSNSVQAMQALHDKLQAQVNQGPQLWGGLSTSDLVMATNGLKALDAALNRGDTGAHGFDTTNQMSLAGPTSRDQGWAVDNLAKQTWQQMNNAASALDRSASKMSRGSQALEAAIDRVKRREAGRTGGLLENSKFVAEEMALADRIIRRGGGVAKVQPIIKVLLQHGDTWAAGQVRTNATPSVKSVGHGGVDPSQLKASQDNLKGAVDGTKSAVTNTKQSVDMVGAGVGVGNALLGMLGMYELMTGNQAAAANANAAARIVDAIWAARPIMNISPVTMNNVYNQTAQYGPTGGTRNVSTTNARGAMG